MSVVAVLAAVLAGGVAAVVRYGITLAFASNSVPWAVLMVNTAASLVGGAAVGLAEVGAVSADIRLVLLSGVAGGLSTFSTWSVESVQLAREGEWRAVTVSVVGNLVLGLAAAALGYVLVLAAS